MYPTQKHTHNNSFEQDLTQGQFQAEFKTGLNSNFFFSYTGSLTKVEDPSLLYYLKQLEGE